MRRIRTICIVLLAALAAPAAARAAVDDVSAAGFALRESVEIAASPDQVYQALTAPSHWWSSEHTYSHDAANLTLDAKAGGCWCESLPGGGSVQHMIVVNAMPGRTLRLRGALGPLQAMAVDGAMTFALTADGTLTHLTASYLVGGYSKPGFAEIAVMVDRVLGEQMNRLKLFIETGSPDAPAQSASMKGVSR
jgi:uncharacterized protein YndB with AHSA1/START domain